MENKYTSDTIFDKVRRSIKGYKFHNWFGLIGLVIYTITLYWTINSFVEYASDEGWKIFFGIFDRFTYQSNWLLFIYMFLYTFKPNHQIFKNNRFLICTMVYIWFTFIGYNVVLVGISKDRGYVGNFLEVSRNAWLHIIAPLWFVVYGYIFMYYNPNQGPDNFVKTLSYGMIYPMIYAIYLITIPFVFTDYQIRGDFYGNEKVTINGVEKYLAYSVYGKATNTVDYQTSYAYIFVMLLGFFPGSFALFNYSWGWLNKFNSRKYQ